MSHLRPPRLRRLVLRLAVLAVGLLYAAPSQADPLRLRGDALALARPPAGLLVLQATGKLKPWMSAEAVVWTGYDDDSGDSEGDALVVAVKLTDPKHRGEARLGRLVMNLGALRPVHMDGATVLGRLPFDLTAEAFGGTLVRRLGGTLTDPSVDESRLDWAAGARLAKRFSRYGTLGVAYMQQRDHGRLGHEEIAADGSLVAGKWLDMAAGAALDLVDLGLAEAQLSAATRHGKWRYELFAGHRSPSRLLPATSLFSVLGDVPSQRVGTSVLWRAAPRLDLRGTGTLRYYHGDFGTDGTDTTPTTHYYTGDFGGELSLRTTLRLDDRGKGSLGLELRRQDAPDAGWYGVRGIAGVPIADRLRAAAELELVVPDHPDERGDLWPWGLASLSWRHGLWDAAAAVEASSSAQYRYELTGLFRLTRQWGMP